MNWLAAAIVGALAGGVTGSITAHLEWPRKKDRRP